MGVWQGVPLQIQSRKLIKLLKLVLLVNFELERNTSRFRAFALQHVSAGHQPIFGLAVACADWVQPRLREALWRSKACWNMRGHAALERAMKYSQDKVLMN